MRICLTLRKKTVHFLQIFQVTAVDQDTGNNARLSYRLQGSAAFRISPNTGWIYLAQTLDRETLDRYALTVLATDNGSPAATASASVLVTVLDDNDNDPRFEKDFYGFELLENLPSGTAVGSVSATDSDLGKNSLLRYAVVQANSSFTVDPDTGKETRLLFPYFSFFLRLHPSNVKSSRRRETLECLRKPRGLGGPRDARVAHAAQKLAEKNIGEYLFPEFAEFRLRTVLGSSCLPRGNPKFRRINPARISHYSPLRPPVFLSRVKFTPESQTARYTRQP